MAEEIPETEKEDFKISKESIGTIIIVVLIAILSFCMGRFSLDRSYIWPGDNEKGLEDLNDKMQPDGTQRLAICVLTEKQRYVLSRINPAKFDFICGIAPKQQDQPPPPPNTNQAVV